MIHSPISFSKKTFAYFDAAQKNSLNKAWYEKHRDDYQKYVQAPFGKLIDLLKIEFSDELPKIHFFPKKLSKPVFKNPDLMGNIIRSNATTFFSEKRTSRFEWNPGIYFSLGSQEDDNVIGIGLYMVSSRQMNQLRRACVEDFDVIDGILSNSKIINHWGDLSGELYKRFPRGYDEHSESAKYLKHKQFFLSQKLTQARITSNHFFEETINDIRCALPFLKWLINSVGTYHPQPFNRTGKVADYSLQTTDKMVPGICSKIGYS
ncbi:MAG: DUF2461 family protein [Chthoniobacterales bacterium]